jgi:D-3-phosphoglycerate dehydrogenase
LIFPDRFNVVMTAPELTPQAVRLLEEAGCTIHYMSPYPGADQVAQLVKDVQADAILCRQGRVSAAVMDASPRLCIVARHGVGMDEVDIAAADARGLLLTRAPGSNTQAVAEHAFALILSLVKQIGPLSATIAAGGWRGSTRVRDVAGRRLGLVGFGAIGQRVARLARAFEMGVAAYDPGAPAEAFASVTRREDLPALLAESEILSLHCPLIPQTFHLIDDAALACLPAGALVINTARGGIIDERALLAAIDAGHIGGAGLDVVEDEPPAADSPLRRHLQVIVTPHVAGVTDGALVNMGVMAAECIVARLTGREVPPERIVKI